MKDYSSIAWLNTSLKNNRDLLKDRRKPFNRDKLEGKESYPYDKALRFKRVSLVKLEKIKRDIKRRREEQDKKLIFALLTTAILLVGIFLIFKEMFF